MACEQIRRALPGCSEELLREIQTEGLEVSAFDSVCASVARNVHAVATGGSPWWRAAAWRATGGCARVLPTAYVLAGGAVWRNV